MTHTASRLALGLLFAFLLAAPVAASRAAPATGAPAAQPALAIQSTVEGGFAIGDPKAPVTLIEYASLTCPHCRHFHEEAMPTLRKLAAQGKLRYEFRNFILNGPDFAATLIARCQGPAGFFRWTDTFFTQQDKWLEPFGRITEQQGESIQKAQPAQQPRMIAELGGLVGWVTARGLKADSVKACLSDVQGQEAVLKLRQLGAEYHGVHLTPSFVLNGLPLSDTGDWATLQPQLNAMLSR